MMEKDKKKPYILFAGRWVDDVGITGQVYRQFQRIPLRRFAGYVEAYVYAARLQRLIKNMQRDALVFFVLSEEYEMQDAAEKKNG